MQRQFNRGLSSRSLCFALLRGKLSSCGEKTRLSGTIHAGGRHHDAFRKDMCKAKVTAVLETAQGALPSKTDDQ